MYNHGVRIQENPTSITPPIVSNAGVQVVVGTAPVNLSTDIERVVNKPVVAFSWAEAIAQLGYSDDWDKFTLCQSMDASFRRIGVAPVIFINVLDPDEHTEAVTAQTLLMENGKGIVETEGIMLDTLVVKSADGATTHTKDEDYTAAFNKDGHVLVTVLDGDILTTVEELQVDFSRLAPEQITNADIIGGYDVVNNLYTGLENITQVYPRLGIVPGQILAPGWSQDPEVASVIAAKSQNINGVFRCTNLLDIDSDTVTSYQDVPEWKNNNSYVSEDTFALWPKVVIGEREYWYSAVMAAVIARTDAQNDDVPYVSPSNKTIPITGMVANGEEVYLDQMQGNFLNGAGVTTAININGWRTWGNRTAAYPGNSDPKDSWLPIRRMFSWWGNTFILTYFQKVDDPTNYRLIENAVDSENIRANGFKARGQLAGAVIEFRKDMNPITQILDGRIVFIQRIAAFIPAEDIVNVLEFDPTLLEEALGGV